MPVPLLAALPLAPQLTLAPAALLSSPAALKQHPARRVVLLFSPASLCPAVAGAVAHGAGCAAGLSPASKGSAASGSWDSSPLGSRGYGSSPAAGAAITFNSNPVFSPGCSMSPAASSPIRGGRTSGGRSLMGTPRIALRFASASVHPEPAADASWQAAPSPTSAGSSPTRPLLGSSRVHPDRSPGAEGCVGRRQPAPLGLPLPGPPLAAPGAARGLGSSRAGSEQAALLHRVLDDRELSAAAAACNAAGVECRPVEVRGAGRGMQQPLALAQWLEQTALPLLDSGASSCVSGGHGGASGLPVLLAVQAGCEAEGAMVAVAHFMQRPASLYQAMVAASQWGIDLHLRQHHLLALQHWAACTEGPTLAPSSARPGSCGGGSARSAA